MDKTLKKEMLTVNEIAPRLGVTPTRVYQLIAAGELPSVRVGGSIRVPLAAWESWLADKSREALASVSGQS